MSYYGSWKIDDTLTFSVNTHNASTGAATDADGVPTYRVYEDETATPILTGSMALLDTANTDGFYSEQLTLSAANGLEKGKSYNVYISATVSSVTGTLSHTFQIEAEVDANVVSDKAGYSADMTSISGDSVAADNAESFFDGTGYAGTGNTIPTVTTLTGHTAQTGDTYALANGATGFTAIDTVVDAIKVVTDALPTTKLAAYFAMLRSGTAQAGASTTITLDAGASSLNGFYENYLIGITSGTGSGQTPRLITGYVGATKVATVSNLWATTPDNTSVFLMIPWGRVTVGRFTPTSITTAAFAAGAINAAAIATDAITAAKIAPDAIGASELATGAVNEIRDAILSDSTPFPGASITEVRLAELGSANLPADVDTLKTGVTVTGHTPQTGDTFALANGAAGFVAIDTVVDGIQTDLDNATDGLGAIKADTAATLIDTADMQPKIGTPAADLSADIAENQTDLNTIITNVAALWTTALTESYAADGVAPTPAQALFLIQQMLTEFAIAGTTWTTKKIDGSTSAATFTLDDATTPTSITRAT